jgi:transcriptional regulator with XRE-family HTH domain
MTFGQRLRQLRKTAGLTQEGLARKANISLSALCKMELKNVDPSFSTVLRLARALEVSVAAFDTEEATAQEPSEEKPRRKGK